jgi:hypothetical protein
MRSATSTLVLSATNEEAQIILSDTLLYIPLNIPKYLLATYGLFVVRVIGGMLAGEGTSIRWCE